MGTAMKQCRVCGKEYEACRSANRTAGVFRWQEVACSEECGTEYLRQINESRKSEGFPAEATCSSTARRSKSKARVDEPVPLFAEAQKDELDYGDTM
jgi:hypothetical protein